MKILFIKEKRSPSGIEGTGIYLLRVCIELKRLNIPYLVLYNDKDELYKKMIENKVNIKIVNLPPYSFRNLLDKKKDVYKIKKIISKIVYEEKITHINLHWPHFLQYIEKNIHVPLIVTWHAAFIDNKTLKYFNLKNIFNPKNFLNNFYEKKYVFNFKKANHVIVPSYAAKQTAIKKYEVDKEKITINPYGVEPIDESKYNSIKKDLGFKNDDILIVCAGKETKAKGVEEFCKVAKYFENRKNFKFIFLGGFKDQVYHDELVKNYGKNVSFLGMRKDINNIYKSSALFLFLSHRESAGIVLLEAMFFGLPLVAWNIIGVNEMFENGVQGRMREFGDLKGIIEDVEEILGDKKLYQKLSENSKKHSLNHLIDKSVNGLLNILKNIKSN